MTPEGKVKAHLRALLDELDNTWYFMPVSNGMGKHGVPDFIVCMHGMFFGFETKTSTGKVNLRQQWALEDIREAGGKAIVVSPENINDVIKDVQGWHRMLSTMNES